MKKKWKIILIGILIAHLSLLIYLKFTAWPEMTLWPYLITKGWLPYRDVAIAHTPLILIKLAVFYKIFGTGILQLKIFTWLIILLFDGMVFAIAKKLWNIKTAFVALCTFVLWTLFFDGNGLWFDLFMGAIAFVSFYFIQKKNFLWAGVFWAAAFVSKQTAVWFLLPIGLELTTSSKHLGRKFKEFITGILSVFIPAILILWIVGILPDFYNWAIKFGIFILPRSSGQLQPPDLKSLAGALFPFLIFIPLIWKTGRKNINLLIWTFAGALGAYPRFEFFHFQPAIPFLAIAISQLASMVKKPDKLMKLFIPVYLLGSVCLFGGFFIRSYKEGTRFYETNVSDIVTFVNYNTKPGDKIFVMNWWDNIYALSDTLPAVDPWIPQLSWYMEIPGIEEKMVNDLRTNSPKLIIYNPYTESGLSAYIPQKLYNYVIENYRLSQKIDGVEILVRNQYAYSNLK